VRSRITEAVATLGYEANPVVRSLRARKTMLVQIVNQPAPTMHPGGDSVLSLGTCIYFLQKSGYTVSASFVRHFPRPEPNVPDFRVDGAVLVGVVDAREVRALEKTGTPYVVINGECGRGGACAKVDERAGMRLVLDHLVGLGHERIAYLGPSHAMSPAQNMEHYSAEERRRAYRAYMSEHGLKSILGPGRGDADAGAFARRVARQGATAIVAYDHLLAIEVLEHVRASRLTAGRDLSLACFNDHTPTDIVTPSLTAVRQPYHEMGYHAARLLLRMMSSDDDRHLGGTVTLTPSLTVRESTSRVPV